MTVYNESAVTIRRMTASPNPIRVTLPRTMQVGDSVRCAGAIPGRFRLLVAYNSNGIQREAWVFDSATGHLAGQTDTTEETVSTCEVQ